MGSISRFFEGDEPTSHQLARCLLDLPNVRVGVQVNLDNDVLVGHRIDTVHYDGFHDKITLTGMGSKEKADAKAEIEGKKEGRWTGHEEGD